MTARLSSARRSSFRALLSSPGAPARLAPWLAALCALAIGLWIWTPLPPGLWHDDGVYLLLGKSLLRGEGLRYFGVPGTPPGAKFPPAYPVLVALDWLIGGDALGAARVAALTNVVFLAAAVGLTVGYGIAVLGLPVGYALAAGGVAAFSVDFWRPALVALSEPSFVLVTMVCLWAAHRAEREDGTARDGLRLALALGLLLYLRTAGAGVAVGILAGLALRGRSKRALQVGGALALLLLPWMVWSSRAKDSIPAPLLDILGPYGPWLAGQIRAAPDAYVARLPAAALTLGLSIVDLVVPEAHPLLWTFAVPTMCVALGFALWRLARRAPAPALAALGSVALAWAWPFQERRLVMPLIPLVALGLACLAHDLARKASGPRRAALATLGVWWIAFVGVSAVRMSLGWVSAGYEERARLLASSLELMRTEVPAGSVVGAPELWPALPLMLPVRSVPSAPFQPAEPHGDPIWGTPLQQYRVWMAGGVRYLVLEEDLIHSAALDALDAACPGAVRLLGSRPGVMLVELAWDRACQERVGVAPRG